MIAAIAKKLGDLIFGRPSLRPTEMSPTQYEQWKQRRDVRLQRVKQEAQVWRRTG